MPSELGTQNEKGAEALGRSSDLTPPPSGTKLTTKPPEENEDGGNGGYLVRKWGDPVRRDNPG